MKSLNKSYPQNLIIEKPIIGLAIFLAICLGFVVLYKPLGLHAARFPGYELSMAIYIVALALPLYLVVILIKLSRYFSNSNEWTILKEILAIFLILTGMGIALYFYGFLFEVPGPRWNLSTLLDSCKHAFLVGIIPFLFFTALNYRHLLVADLVKNFNPQSSGLTPLDQSEKQIRITSQLKKEELTFYPSQLVYAESDGNYVVFYLNINNQVQKKIIRNSINNIEQQLSGIPFIVRTHRAFIVNVRQVMTQKGNTLGYRLKLKAVDDIIPVSRQNVRNFDSLLKQPT